MPQPVDYNTFVANVNSDDLAIMTNFVVGGTINTANDVEAEALFQQCVRLYQAGMISEVMRHYAEVDGVIRQDFQGLVTPVGAGYLVRLARERLILSRDPIPTEEPV